MLPQQRLGNILWEGQLRGSVPYGATNLMVCLSESPVEHLRWLLGNRQFPGWGLVFSRQWVYNFGGGPVWYPRSEQHVALTPSQRDWAVRLDTRRSIGKQSDWLHEREWRIPVQPGYSALAVRPGALQAILVEDSRWAPWKLADVETGFFFDEAGQYTDDTSAHPEIRREWQLPALWHTAPRWFWSRQTCQLIPAAAT